mgnify:FL=1
MEINQGLPELEGRYVRLRPLRRADTRALLAVLADPSVSRWWGTYDAAKVERDFFDPAWAYTYLVEVDGATIGLVQFHEVPDPDYKHAGVDITLDGAHQNQGLGTEVLQVLIRYLIDGRGHHRITIDPAADNSRAIHTYEKVGFKPVGIMRRYERGDDGRFHDGLLMDLLAEEFVDAPSVHP